MNRPQGDQAMRPMVPAWPRQMHRSLIPGTGSSPTFTPSASSMGGYFSRCLLIGMILFCVGLA